MQVGMSTASLFNRCNLEDAPFKLSGYGVELCEVFLNTFSEYEEAFILLLRQRIHEAGLQVYSVHPMGTQFEPQLFSIHPRQKSDAVEIYRRVLRAAKLLGAEYYVMHGPNSLGGVVKNMEFQRIGPVVRELCALAAEYGLRIAWENVSWGLYSYPAFGPRLLEASRAEGLHFTLDIKQAARSGYPPEEFLYAMQGHMANLHLCDYVYTPERMRPALPGRGACDFKKLKREIDASGYRGPAFFEIYSDLYANEAEMLQSYAYVKEIFS